MPIATWHAIISTTVEGWQKAREKQQTREGLLWSPKLFSSPLLFLWLLTRPWEMERKPPRGLPNGLSLSPQSKVFLVSFKLRSYYSGGFCGYSQNTKDSSVQDKRDIPPWCVSGQLHFPCATKTSSPTYFKTMASSQLNSCNTLAFLESSLATCSPSVSLNSFFHQFSFVLFYF